MTKINKAAVLYFPPSVIETAGPSYTKKLGPGAVCMKCSMFATGTSTCSLMPKFDGKVSGVKGVCGMFVPGVPCDKEKDHHGQLSRAQLGYVETGPTHCEDCKHLGNGAGYKRGEHPCEIVEGTVEENGCCNAFQR